MQFVSYSRAGQARWGVLSGDEVREVADAGLERFPSLRSAIVHGGDVSELGALAIGPSVPLGEVELAPVIPDPGKIICVGHNYESHRQETGRAKVAHPSLFVRFADSLVAAGAPIVKPRESDALDFEGELAVVIGRGGRRITPEQALEHVAGYACFNDASIRDWQWHTQQFTPGKNFPSTGAFGPSLVTPDEVGDPSALRVTTTLNGEVMQDQPTADMLFDVASIIAYASTFTALSPGDVICTGTPGGVGAKRTPPRWMKGGDRVEVEIPRVGRLTNPITCESND